MVSSNAIIGECYAEKALVKFLLKIDSCNKVQGKTVVLSKIEKNQNCCFGIIDFDKDLTEAKYYNNYISIYDDNYIKLIKHCEKKSFIAVLKPGLEKWFENICKVSDIKIEDYGFEPGFKGLKKESKLDSFDHKLEFKRLINELVRKENPCILKLHTWISNFRVSYGENVF